jgi:hypothetical protein
MTAEPLEFPRCRCTRVIQDSRFKTCEGCRANHRRYYAANRQAHRRYMRDYNDLGRKRKVCESCRQVIQPRLVRDPL